MLSGRFHIAEDRWRVTSLLAFARIKYDFFGVGSDAGERRDLSQGQVRFTKLVLRPC